MKQLSRLQLEQKITDLETKNKETIASSELMKIEHESAINKLNLESETNLTNLKNGNDLIVTGLETQIETLSQQVDQKQKQLDRKELKKLAQAYEEQEEIYKTGAGKWLKWLMIIGVALIFSTIFSIWLSSDKQWYDKFEYYLVDIIFLSAIWFCSSQYADQVKLRNDYANRKTISQSFHNILNNLAEDLPIKNKFIEKATDVLCAPSPVSGKEPVLSKKIIKDTFDIVSSIKGS